MKFINKIKNFLELEDRVLDLEVDKEIQEWTLERFYKTFQYNHLSELSELKVRLLMRLLQASKVYVSFERPLGRSASISYDIMRRTLFLEHKNICVGVVLDTLQHLNAITIMKRRKEDVKDAETKTPAEVSA